ncbi:MAG TPA: NAD/NADP octopine/nopaline dehydrogenase family protein, partial [Urbifossiella sp.]|nr:NAD/NADP octopine/nopaline dehydrogenase family protein [Urbifossiella sp.]
MKSVAVLGAGHGGLALAGDLALHGFRVHLWNRSAGPLAKVRSEGGIRLSHGASPSRFAPVAAATCRIGATLEQADAVLVAVPACAHADIARAAAPYLRDRHSVLLLPGRTGGAMEFQRVLVQSGCRSRVLVGETNTFPFASRCTEPGAAAIYGTKAEMLAAALAPHRTPELLDAFRPLLPMLQPAQSVLQTGFGNVGAILHPTITLMNRERIRSGDAFDFYTDGVTPEVAEVLAAADEERL